MAKAKKCLKNKSPNQGTNKSPNQGTKRLKDR